MRSTTLYHVRKFDSFCLHCLFVITLSLLAVTLFTAGSNAAPPHPSLLNQQRSQAVSASQDGTTSTPSIMIPDLDALHERGICTADDNYLSRYVAARTAAKTNGQLAPAASGFRVLALLVDFSDHPATVNPTFFDTLIFGSGNGTIADFIDEISYGQVTLTTNNLPSTIGWVRAPHPYSYYVDGQQGVGLYPQNSQGLVVDLVDAVDSQVDFSPYDNDDDGYVDVLLVIHTGTGAELTGSPDDIWSHKWAITARNKDGVYISSFTVQPEFWSTPGDMTIGVYAHELCHGFGLPDLYDTDYSSKGAGQWCLMGYGAWNGALGEAPAHPSAWCRIEMGFATPHTVAQNLSQEAIPSVESGGDIYRINLSTNEYFLIENRQRTGYDTGLPGDGLLIWHVDEAKSGNTTEWYPGRPNSGHYMVALEQADNEYDLEHNIGYGDTGDPFPGSTDNRTFDTTSAPAATSYTVDTLWAGVTNISSSGATMYADLLVDTTGMSTGTDDDPIVPVTFELEQNYPNPFNPSTTIAFSLDAAADINLSVYNSLGQKVATLIDGPVSAGTTEMQWNATNDNGEQVASGIYLYQLAVDDEKETRKMLLVR